MDECFFGERGREDDVWGVVMERRVRKRTEREGERGREMLKNRRGKEEMRRWERE